MDHASVSKLIGRYGRLIEIGGDPVIYTSAFIQPLRPRDKSLFGGEFSKAGYTEDRYFVYIGPAEYSLRERLCETVRDGANVYRVVRAEDIYYAGEAVYCWGILCAARAVLN